MKEIIIDGCNVAECPFYQYQTPDDYKMKYPESGDCEIGMAGYLFDYDRINEELEKECISNHNCFFKQLQRAKAEKQDLINYFELREGGMEEDIQYWKNKAQEIYKELEQYKKSKQASYEAMQIEWNNAVNELRYFEAENERLKLMLSEKYGVYR